MKGQKGKNTKVDLFDGEVVFVLFGVPSGFFESEGKHRAVKVNANTTCRSEFMTCGQEQHPLWEVVFVCSCVPKMRESYPRRCSTRTRDTGMFERFRHVFTLYHAVPKSNSI